MEATKKVIKDDNDLRVSFNVDTIRPSENEYWILVENCSIEYDFKFPLESSQFEDHESALPLANIVSYGLKFKNCTFENRVALYKKTKADRNIFFEDCTFKKNILLRNSKVVITFLECKFKDVFLAMNAKLEGKIKFWACNFYEDANFRNTKFLELADFWRSTFHKKTIFYKTDFLNTVVFSASTFKENVLFTYTLINKLILLRGTKVEKGFDLSLAIIYGKLGLFGFDLNDYKDYEFINDENEYETAVSENAIIPIKNKRETFRILKDNLESQKNLSEALKFKAIEKEVLRLELNKFKAINSSDSYFLKLKSKFNNYLERFNLWLNKLSNEYGSSYGKSFIFIVLLGWIIFYLSLLSTETYTFSVSPSDWEFNEGVKFFIEFLNPLHKSDYMGEEIILSTGFYIIDFFGKIIVGYGIYQFIQAFRKYK